MALGQPIFDYNDGKYDFLWFYKVRFYIKELYEVIPISLADLYVLIDFSKENTPSIHRHLF